MAKAKEQVLSLEERLEQALVPKSEQPYSIPENWSFFYFTSLIDVQGGTQPPKSTFIDVPQEGYVRLVQIRDFTSDKYKVYIPDKRNLRKFFDDDILIARYGASLGRICTGLSGAYNVALAKAIFNTNALLPRYVYWLLQSECFQMPLMQLSRTAQAGFNKDDLSYFATPLPPLAEQRRIVIQIESLFQKLDNARDLVQNALDSFETRKAAILHKAFTGELTAKWRAENGVSLDSWKTTTINDICSSLQYGTSKKSHNSGDVVVIRMGNLQNGEIVWDNLAYSSDAAEIHKYLLQTGDVLFNRTNSPELVGKTSIYRGEKPAIFAGYLIRLNYKHSLIVGEYLNYVLNSMDAKEYCNKVKTDGVNQSNINAKKIGAYSFKLPTFLEQQEIARILDSLLENEQKAKDICDVLDQIELMKKSILARAFRGELGTNDPGEESALELLKEVLTETVSG